MSAEPVTHHGRELEPIGFVLPGSGLCLCVCRASQCEGKRYQDYISHRAILRYACKMFTAAYIEKVKKMKSGLNSFAALLIVMIGMTGCAQEATDQQAVELSDAQVEDIVRLSYGYVAMYNVNNKSAMDESNPLSSGGWNRINPQTALADHTVQIIARPNNDTLYVVAMLDLSKEPVILDAPALGSKYVSLMVTGYDHYVNIPMSTQQGDFSEPSRILFYTERSGGYAGEAIEGIDRIAEMTGDFVSAVYRVMPHANEPDRFKQITDAMQSIKVVPLSEFRSGSAAQTGDAPDFPAYGQNDFDIFEYNLLEVMQFVFNHTTFHADDEIDQQVLAAFKPLGVEPGREFDASKAAELDGTKFRNVAERVAARKIAGMSDTEFTARFINDLFQRKGEMSLDAMVYQSVVGPIGQPRDEAVYPAVTTPDGTPMNAMNDYVIHMTRDEMPPATAFWSATAYDTENGFFLPNDAMKYSVGENAGMKLDDEGGISIYLSAERPEGVPEENWLPMARGDYGVDVIMRIYAPDLERFATWQSPKAESVE